MIMNFVLSILIAMAVLSSPNSDGAQMIYTGILLNSIALATNNWQMPVYGVSVKQFEKRNDGRHQLGNANTNFKFLCDYIPIGIGVASPGDLLMFLGTFLVYEYDF